jgi:hypothetical protein
MKYISRLLDLMCRVIALMLPRRLKYWITLQSIGEACHMRTDVRGTRVGTVIDLMAKNKPSWKE